MSDIFMSKADGSSNSGSIDPFDIRQVVLKHRLRFFVKVSQPLVLISQIQRSGGTLVSQLLDGHPQLHVHPGELHIGRPNKYHWPDLDITKDASSLFDDVREKLTVKGAERGYQKQSDAEANYDPRYKEKVLPFIFDLTLQRKLFERMIESNPPASQRDALNYYVTSYFNAWLDYQGLYRAPGLVRYWACFAARILAKPGNVDAFFADYPDGKVITVLRDPISWFASAKPHSEEYADKEGAIDLWCSSYEVLHQAMTNRDGQYLMLTFEETVEETDSAMRRVAAFLNIKFNKSMRRPTFNGLPIRSDSSFGSQIGLDKSAIDRSHAVPRDVQNYIRDRTEGLYNSLRRVTQDHMELYK